MKAVVHHRYGSADVLSLDEIEKPVAKDDEVLIRVRAASVNHADLLLVRGVPYLLRLAFGLRRPRSIVRGRDVAGVVAAVGRRVTRFRPGDEVYAEVDTGSFAVQIAKALGAEVTGVCSTRNVDLVRSLGADHVIDYTTVDFTTVDLTGGHHHDVIFDIVGNHSLAALRRVLTRHGTLVLCSDAGGRWVGPIGRIIRALLLAPFVGQRLRPFLATRSSTDLAVLTELIEAGRLTPAIDRTYPLDQTPAAIRYLEQEHARAKVVITV